MVLEVFSSLDDSMILDKYPTVYIPNYLPIYLSNFANTGFLFPVLKYSPAMFCVMVHPFLFTQYTHSFKHL